ncbi:hypothetical protein AB0M39_42045, partial [Streptomyces sp. NPDC051907]|uniref:hypothetical protein n=1 Tax=Streptomyces sp. NPDC051907 TaxID=3155284 RepID=UPI0034233371
GDHPDDGQPGHEGRVVRCYRHPEFPGDAVCPHCRLQLRIHGWIESGDDGHVVCPSDWIVTTPSGEHIPVPDIAFRTFWSPA